MITSVEVTKTLVSTPPIFVGLKFPYPKVAL